MRIERHFSQNPLEQQTNCGIVFMQTSTVAIKQDVENFQSWRSMAAVPTNESREDSDRANPVSNSLRKAFFEKEGLHLALALALALSLIFTWLDWIGADILVIIPKKEKELSQGVTQASDHNSIDTKNKEEEEEVKK
ncbi:hypothetical protein J3Q64DRAFT_1818662 [Phycomyces blakesleeanus]|uniref:Transmembrane protein n=1 Tax=Phycomyces blakesleeanus TaxID=4837 RepID=A0ABR3B949_PHYBL